MSKDSQVNQKFAGIKGVKIYLKRTVGKVDEQNVWRINTRINTMSCWVVPTIAADYWQVSLDHVMQGIREGWIASKSEQGFTFVDVMPEVDLAKAKAKPQTFVEALAVQNSDSDEFESEL